MVFPLKQTRTVPFCEPSPDLRAQSLSLVQMIRRHAAELHEVGWSPTADSHLAMEAMVAMVAMACGSHGELRGKSTRKLKDTDVKDVKE